MPLKPFHVAVLVITLVIAFIVAWGANEYYGHRQMNQDRLLPDALQSLVYATFDWEMNGPKELIIDDNHIGAYSFRDSSFHFQLVEDTYFLLDLKEQPLVADFHFIMRLICQTPNEGGKIRISLGITENNQINYFVSENITLEQGQIRQRIDLSSLKFETTENPDKVYHWGDDLKHAELIRIDWNGFDGEVVVDSISLLSGVTSLYTLTEIFADGTATGSEIAPNGKAIKVEKKEKSATFVTPPIGVGTIKSFLDVHALKPEGNVKLFVRSGNKLTGEFKWSDWLEVPENDSITDLPIDTFLQVKIELQRTKRIKDSPSVEGLRVRVLDPSPPGLGGPLFGTAHLPTLTKATSFQKILNSSSHTVWVRLPHRYEKFDERVNELTASDINIVASVNLDAVSLPKLYQMVERYKSRILVWELYASDPKGSPYYTEVFSRVKQINPMAVIFPERANHDYFQNLALKNLEGFSAAQGSQEEVLNRGFWFYFIVIFIGLAVIIALGPVLGYNFHFGILEIKHFFIGIALSIVLLMPIILLSGIGQLALPRDFAQVKIAFSRFMLSALFQEFLHGLTLLLAVRYLMAAHLTEKKAWVYAITGTSLLFGLSHLGYPGFSTYEVGVFVLITAVAFAIVGYIFYKTRSLTTLALVHLIWNIAFSTMTTIGGRF